MPFADAAERRAYMRGYHRAYTKSKSERPRLRATDIPLEEARLVSAFRKGWTAGCQNRDGDARARYRAQWYQQNRKRIYAKQKRQRRAVSAQKALAAVQALQALCPPP